MHSAPAVSYPVGRSRFQEGLVALGCLAGVLAGALWYFEASPGGWRPWLFAATLAGASLAALQSVRRCPRGILRWDGQAWSWTGDGGPACGILMVHLDLQFCLVLSLRPEVGRRRWLWPQRRSDAPRWRDLRRAVFTDTGRVLPQEPAPVAAQTQVSR